MASTLGWGGVARLGLVQMALGAIVVLTTSTLNRVMVVELALAAAVPGLLVGLHYAVQILRPLWGHASDVGGRRTPWIIGGVAMLGTGGTLAAAAVALVPSSLAAGLALAIVAFVLIGVGVGAAGTSLLALLAAGVDPQRRPAAAMTVWLMMIAGMAVTAGVAGNLLEPFSFGRLLTITAGTGLAALIVTMLAMYGVERRLASRVAVGGEVPPAFRDALADAWRDPAARLFTIFIFVSMLAYSAQDLILEPFAGLVFGFAPGETTKLAGLQHGGVFAGMLATGIAGSLWARSYPAALRVLTVAGCLASALALAGLAAGAASGGAWHLKANVFALGVANGCFAVAAIGSMMALAGAAGPRRSGMRMGLWGAAQGVAFGVGGLAGAVMVDLLRALTRSAELSFGLAFATESLAFLVAAAIAVRIAAPRAADRPVGRARTSSLMAAE